MYTSNKISFLVIILFARVVDPAIIFVIRSVDLFIRALAACNITIGQTFQQVLNSLK